MSIITYAMSKPKVIDLDAYGLTEVMLALIGEGGGEIVVGADTINGATIWDEIRTNRPLAVSFQFEAVRSTVNVHRADFPSESGELGLPASIGFEAAMFLNSTSVMRVIVSLDYASANPTGVTMRVKVIHE